MLAEWLEKLFGVDQTVCCDCRKDKDGSVPSQGPSFQVVASIVCERVGVSSLRLLFRITFFQSHNLWSWNHLPGGFQWQVACARSPRRRSWRPLWGSPGDPQRHLISPVFVNLMTSCVLDRDRLEMCFLPSTASMLRACVRRTFRVFVLGSKALR